MKRKTTVIIEKAELTTLVMDNLDGGEVKVSVPRKEGEKPTATIKISSDVLASALAQGLSDDDNEVSVDDLAAVEMSVKKNGDVELTF